MNDRVGVVEDGVSEAPERDRSRSPWLIAAVAFAVGLGLGAVAAGPSGEPTQQLDSDVAVPPNLDAPDPDEEDAVDERGISEVVDGFPDALVAIARTSGSTVDYLLWPVAGDLSNRAMAGGADVLLDATSQFVALSSGLPGNEEVVLSMGRHNSLRPVAPGVTSYAFHDTANGWLAYTVDDGDLTHLLTVKSDFEPFAVTTLNRAHAEVVGWGDWGFALQDPSGEIVLLNSQGEFKDSEVGVGLATHGSGWVLAAEGLDLKLVSAGGGVRRLGQVEGLGALQTVSFSPDGAMLALDGERRLGVLDIASGGLTHLSDFSTGPVAWSSDSRFVVAASSSGVLIYDLATGDVHPILRQYTILSAGVVPLSNS